MLRKIKIVEQEESMFYEFDKIKYFKIYFPQWNLLRIT
jgi:hypothetical protein